MQVRLSDGSMVIGDYFEESDFNKIKEVFRKWYSLNADLRSLGGRGMNVPDVISEALYCYYFDAVRTNGVGYSYDAINLKTSEGVQIKSTSVSGDVTSFGPRSTWDKLFFLDFAPEGMVNGLVDIYEISADISAIIMNKSKSETFADQQLQGRRPRFSIKKEIIAKFALQPVKQISLL